MQMREHELSGAQLEQSEDGRDAANPQGWGSSQQEPEQQLRRYDDEEVVTKPWPPQRW
jgi:hypothetical protein